MEVGGWGTMLMPLSFHNHGVLFHLLQGTTHGRRNHYRVAGSNHKYHYRVAGSNHKSAHNTVTNHHSHDHQRHNHPALSYEAVRVYYRRSWNARRKHSVIEATGTLCAEKTVDRTT